MPPEEPGAPSSPPRDGGHTATFGAGVEQAETSERKVPPTSSADEAGSPPKVNPPRRRLLDDPDPDRDPNAPKAAKRTKVRARKVHRIVRHIEPWSVLKISVLFFASIFLIICVASAVLWNAARSAGAIDDIESFVTSLGFGNCENIDGEDTATTPTSATIDGGQPQVVDGSSTTVPAEETPEDDRSTIPDEDGECAEGQRLVGGFKFEDQRIFESFALGGIVLVLTGASASVVLVLLFNLISDLTGGVRVTVLEEEPTRGRKDSPAPATRE